MFRTTLMLSTLLVLTPQAHAGQWTFSETPTAYADRIGRVESDKKIVDFNKIGSGDYKITRTEHFISMTLPNTGSTNNKVHLIAHHNFEKWGEFTGGTRDSSELDAREDERTDSAYGPKYYSIKLPLDLPLRLTSDGASSTYSKKSYYRTDISKDTYSSSPDISVSHHASHMEGVNYFSVFTQGKKAFGPQTRATVYYHNINGKDVMGVCRQSQSNPSEISLEVIFFSEDTYVNVRSFYTTRKQVSEWVELLRDRIHPTTFDKPERATFLEGNEQIILKPLHVTPGSLYDSFFDADLEIKAVITGKKRSAEVSVALGLIRKKTEGRGRQAINDGPIVITAVHDVSAVQVKLMEEDLFSEDNLGENGFSIGDLIQASKLQHLYFQELVDQLDAIEKEFAGREEYQRVSMAVELLVAEEIEKARGQRWDVIGNFRLPRSLKGEYIPLKNLAATLRNDFIEGRPTTWTVTDTQTQRGLSLVFEITFKR